jgi:hypothetical protein
MILPGLEELSLETLYSKLGINQQLLGTPSLSLGILGEIEYLLLPGLEE